MKSVLISIHPQWVEKIANGEKTIEVRKTRPKLEPPFKCLIYCTIARKNGQPLLFYKDGTICFGDYREAFNCNADGEVDCYIGEGKVIGEFICDSIKVEYISPRYSYLDARCVGGTGYILNKSCLTAKEFISYGKGKKLYGWNISDLKIYDKPKELSEFCKGCNDSNDPIYGSYCSYCEKKKRLSRPPQSWCYVEGEK